MNIVTYYLVAFVSYINLMAEGIIIYRKYIGLVF